MTIGHKLTSESGIELELNGERGYIFLGHRDHAEIERLVREYEEIDGDEFPYHIETGWTRIYSRDEEREWPPKGFPEAADYAEYYSPALSESHGAVATTTVECI